MKDDYVIALRDYFINQKFGSKDKVPWALKFMLSIETPQLCRRIQTLKEADQKKVWESCDWIAEEKIDGVRMLIAWNATEKKFSFFSRNNSVTDYLPQDYSDTILVNAKDFDYPDNFVLDSEIVSVDSDVETNTQCLTQLQSTAALLNLNAEDSRKIQKSHPLKFIVFDCLFDKENLIETAWTNRHTHAEKLAALLKSKGFKCELNRVVENTDDDNGIKRDFYEEVISRNGEGVVLKNKNAKYHACSSRTIDCVKVKRSTTDSVANDIDAFITDYVVGNSDTRNENMVVGFVFSIPMEKDDGTVVSHPIATCSNVSDFIKEDATVIAEDGTVTLNPDYYGRVATVKGQNISARNLRMTHAVIEAWRPDKSSLGCEKIKESELRAMVF
jgi:ATP-dependent DNA ligase